jgi:hypothetical protein
MAGQQTAASRAGRVADLSVLRWPEASRGEGRQRHRAWPGPRASPRCWGSRRTRRRGRACGGRGLARTPLGASAGPRLGSPSRDDVGGDRRLARPGSGRRPVCTWPGWGGLLGPPAPRLAGDGPELVPLCLARACQLPARLCPRPGPLAGSAPPPQGSEGWGTGLQEEALTRPRWAQGSRGDSGERGAEPGGCHW